MLIKEAAAEGAKIGRLARPLFTTNYVALWQNMSYLYIL